MKRTLLTLSLLSITVVTVLAQAPPSNPNVADSPFPMVHRNNYRQGYFDLPALKASGGVVTQTAFTPRDRVSPWLQISERYADGQRDFFGSTSTHFFKAIATRDTFGLVAEYQIDNDPAINDLSWAFVLLGRNRYLTYDDDRLIVLRDDPRAVRSKLIEERIVRLPAVIGAG